MKLLERLTYCITGILDMQWRSEDFKELRKLMTVNHWVGGSSPPQGAILFHGLVIILRLEVLFHLRAISVLSA